MKPNKKHIDDLFRDNLGYYAETPPPAVWDGLEKRLSNVPPVPKKVPLGITRYLLVVSSAVVVSFFIARIAGKSSNPSFTDISQTKTEATRNNITTANHNNATARNTVVLTQNNQTANNSTTATMENALATNTTGTSAKDQGTGIQAPQELNDQTMPSVAIKANRSAAANQTMATADSKNGGQTTGTGHTNNLRSRKFTNNLAKSQHGKHDNTSKNYSVNKLNELNSSSPVLSARTVPDDNNSENQLFLQHTSIASLDANTLLKAEFPVWSRMDSLTVPGGVPVKHTMPGKLKNKFEMGVKAGYESGLNSQAGKKSVISPYVQYKLSDKFSLMIQPAVKYAKLSTQKLTGAQSFYKANNDSSVSIKSYPMPLGLGEVTNDSVELVTYSQSHDSVVKSYIVGGHYFEMELPVLLRYSLTKHIGIYGGVTASYSRYVAITEQTYTSAPITVSTTTETVVAGGAANVVPAAVNSEVTFPGRSLVYYKSPLYVSPNKGLFSMGYMLGINYEYSNRWLLDVLMLQAAPKTAVIGGYNTNAPFSAPYFRITLGYKLF